MTTSGQTWTVHTFLYHSDYLTSIYPCIPLLFCLVIYSFLVISVSSSSSLPAMYSW